MGLLGRLTHGQEPIIGLHGFVSALREYARGGLTKGAVSSNYSIDPQDNQAQDLLNLIDDETGVDAKLAKVNEIADILKLHEGLDSRALYPDAQSIANRLGI